MQWFIKGLRQYADFGGRARRKEYWMFTLWDVIFYLVWMFAANLILFLIIGPAPTGYAGSSHGPTLFAVRVSAGMAATGLCYGIALLLPRLAVTVRRLHDVGRSAWMLFVALIPIVGPIWLLILMVTNGQRGENHYGPDPKAPLLAVDNNVLRGNAGGIMLIIAASAVALPWIAQGWSLVQYLANRPLPNEVLLLLGMIVLVLLFLAAGACLLRRKVNSAFILLLVAACIHLVLDAMSAWNYINYIHSHSVGVVDWSSFAFNVFGAASWLTLALFAASVLWRQAVARQAAVAVIILSVPWLLIFVHCNMQAIERWLLMVNSLVASARFLLFLTASFLVPVVNTIVPVALIVLAAEFLARSKTAMGGKLTQGTI